MKSFGGGSLARSSYCGSELLNLTHFLFFFAQIKTKATKQVKSQSLFLLKTWKMFLVRMQLCR